MTINARKHKRTVSCSYCRQERHTVANCPQVSIDGVKAEKKEQAGQALNYVESYALQRWRKNEEIRGNRTKRRSNPKPRKCGFCSHQGHTRRHCQTLKDTHALFLDANRIWRSLWAHTSVEFGFAPASLIKVTNSSFYSSRRADITGEWIGLVGNQMPDNLSIFAIANDYDMRQEIVIPLASGGEPSLRIKEFLGNHDLGSFLSAGYSWGYVENIEVLSQSTYQYPTEWIDAPPKDLEYVLRRWNSDRLQRFKAKVESFMTYASEQWGIS